MPNTPLKLPNLYSRIYTLISSIPAGKVATYGQIAIMAGCTARQVGWALASAPENVSIPWHRVINSQGKISPRADGNAGALQKVLLKQEGIEFSSTGKVDFRKFGWQGEI